jgi:hypothetical protein
LSPSTSSDSTDWRGSRLDSGSWKIICMRRRARRIFSPLSERTSVPSKMISPAVGSTSRSRPRPSVDLPQPDSPTSPYVSPALMDRETPSTAYT